MQPLQVKHTVAELKGWKFLFEDYGIATSKEIEAIGNELDLFQIPTIIFNKTSAAIEHASGFRIEFTAKQGLSLINFKQRAKMFVAPDTEGPVEANHITFIPPKVEIKHAKHWKTLKKPADIELTELEQVSDSFFVTPFKGTVTSTHAKVQRVKEDVIPLHKLGAHNEMVFYHEGCLYEDELNDNGVSVYDYKFRHMKDSWFLLARSYLRVDEVCVYILDTRLYWEEGFGSRVARQFMVKFGTWQSIKQKGFNLGAGWSTNPHQSHMVYPHLETLLTDNEYILFEP